MVDLIFKCELVSFKSLIMHFTSLSIVNRSAAKCNNKFKKSIQRIHVLFISFSQEQAKKMDKNIR